MANQLGYGYRDQADARGELRVMFGVVDVVGGVVVYEEMNLLLDKDTSVDIVTKTVVSRRKSIVQLEKECADLEARIRAVGATSSAGVVLNSVAVPKRQRLNRLRVELLELEKLLEAAGAQLPLQAGASSSASSSSSTKEKGHR